MNIYLYLLEMLPVGGVDSEAVKHSTVVPGQSHRFIFIIPAWFNYMYFHTLKCQAKSNQFIYLLTLVCCCRSSGGGTLG